MQRELNFAGNQPDGGYQQWIAQRAAAEQALARSLGLPLGRHCEVWLKDGVRLKGILRLRESRLFVEGESHQNTEFEVDGFAFRYREMEVCTRDD